MSPSSSNVDRRPFDFLVAHGPVQAATSLASWVGAMLEVEQALAGAQAELGLVPTGAATAIGALAVDALDLEALVDAAGDGGNLAIPLVEQVRAAVGEAAAPAVHAGATSQDVVDTAAMLVVARSGQLVTDGLTAAAARAGVLQGDHGAAPMVGRTLLQHAEPTTFGALAGSWRFALQDAAGALGALGARLPVQLGGPVGDRAPYGEQGGALAAAVAARLGLTAAPSWAARRRPVTDVAGVWGGAAATVAGIATDVVVLAGSDVAEVAEVAPGAGGSSSMPYKRNPVAAVSARAAAMQVPGLTATLLHAAGSHELQRAAGAWHAEWPALHALLNATGSAVAWVGVSLDRLVVDPARMAANLHRALDDRGRT